MSDLDAKIRALEEQVARENAEVERSRQQQQQQQHTFVQTAAAAPTPRGGAGGADAFGGAKPPPRFAPDADSRSVFVQGLPKQNESPEEVAAFFADCGQVQKCTVLKDKTSGALKGSAYVEFATQEAAGRACDNKNNAAFRGSFPLQVARKKSLFNPTRARGGAGSAPRGRGGASDPTAMAANMAAQMMGAMMGAMMMGQGGAAVPGMPPGGPMGRGGGSVSPFGAGVPRGRGLGGRGGGFRPF